MRPHRLCLLVVVLLAVVAVHAQEMNRRPQHAGTPAAAEAPRFKFAVISDRYSGRKPGSTILEEAVREINLIDPDFTISIGDLIGGSDDPDKVNRQWDEFDADIRKLKRPFYYVFGNHDATNPVMVDILRRRYGAPYYSFNHKGCHFIVLFTETFDKDGKLIGLSRDAGQIAWLRRDLAVSAGALHTFVFFHKPWPSPEIMGLFKRRPTTVFAGHTHEYEQFTKDGINYHVLSTTGGGIDGDFYAGSFYHYVLVTVSGREVSTAIVRVGAVLPDDLLSVERKERITAARAALGTVYLKVPRNATAVDQTLELSIPNPLVAPVKGTCEWIIPAGSPWSVTPVRADFVVDAGSEKPVAFKVALAGDPFAADEALRPVLSIKALGGRALTAHSPTAAGLDALYDVTTPVTPDRWPYTENLVLFRKSVAIPEIPLAASLDQPVVLTVTNPFDHDVKAELVWQVRNPNWTVTPPDSALDIPKGASQVTTFTAAFNGRADGVFPVPRLATRVVCDGEKVFDESAPLPVNASALVRKHTPTLTCRTLPARPVLDGKPDDPGWKDAATVDTFILGTGTTEPAQPTVVRLGTTDDGLWLAFECTEPARNKVRAKVAERDGTVWEDDSAEIFLDTHCDRKTYFQFIFNTIGTSYDGREKDKSWNGTWEVKTGWREGAWTAEVFVPWESVGGKPAPGTKWGVNLLRNRTVTPGEYSMWSPTLGSAHTPTRFGTVVFE